MAFAQYFAVAIRWDVGRDSKITDFAQIDQVGGSLDDAKAVAQSYLNRHCASDANVIEWVEGISRGKKCYYGRSDVITFRIIAC